MSEMAEFNGVSDVTEIVDPPLAGIFHTMPADMVPPPLPYHSDFGIMLHRWTGTDGSVWNLSNPDEGVFIVQEDLEGMHTPVTDDINRESPSIAGSSFQGYRVKARDVVWGVYLFTDENSEAFYDLDRRFWDSMKIGQYGTWRVTRPDGAFRELSMRPVAQSYSFERDPGRFGWVKYAVRFLADVNPFWTIPYEVPGSRLTVSSDVGDNFFGGDTGVGAPFIISPSRAETSRSIYNDGDEDVWPIITIQGPMDFVDIVIGKRKYHIDCDVQGDEWFKIDTTPYNFRIYDSTGANRISSLDNWVFEPFPSKKTTKIEVLPQGIGGGSVVFDVPPLYHRAW